MNTKINLTYKGETYTLEYDRTTVALLENTSFKLDEFLDKPMSNIELAFAGSFLKNHNKTPQTVIDEIYKKTPNKKALIVTLRNMISESYEALLEDPDEGDEGNATWEVVDLSPTKTNQK